MATESFYKDFKLITKEEIESLLRALENAQSIIIDKELVNEEKEQQGIEKVKGMFLKTNKPA